MNERLVGPRHGLRWMALALSVLVAPVLAEDAQDLSSVPFEQLVQREVVPASRIARQISDSPSAVAIVTAADIRAYGYRTIADVINSMRGLYTTYDHRYQYMGGRGFGVPGDYAGRIMVLIDGYVTQDSLFNQAYIDDSGLLDLELVERVEYVPGTGSVTYGNNALLGIINIVTRKGQDFDAFQVSGEVASHGRRKQRATFGKRLENGGDLLLSASLLDVDARNLYFPAYDTPATHNGLAERRDGEGSRRFFGKYAFEGLILETGYVDRKKEMPTPTSVYGAFNRPFTMRDENAFLNAAYDTDLSLTLRSASRFYMGDYTFHSQREYAFSSYGPPDGDNEQYSDRKYKAQWWGLDQKFVGQWFERHSIVFGFEYRNDYRQNFHWLFLSPERIAQRDIHVNYSRHTSSLYLTDEYRFDDQWALNVGGRYDQASDLAGNLSPRLAVIYSPTSQTTWKASYSRAFRMPNADDYSSYDELAKPEYVAAGELVLQHQLSRELRLTSSAYRYLRTGQMVYNADVDSFRDNGRSTTRGLEVELEGQWANGIRARTSGAWQRAENTDGGWLANSPHFLGKFNLSVPLPGDAVRAGFEAHYLGPRLTLEQRRLGGVALASLTFSSERKWNGVSASFSIRNLFDHAYEVVSPFDWRPDSGLRQDSLRMDGRTYWLQLNYDL